MDLEDFIQQLRDMARGIEKPTVSLFDREDGIELVNDPERGHFEFEVYRGDDGPIIEFN